MLKKHSLRDENRQGVNALFNSIMKESETFHSLSVQQLSCDRMEEMGKQHCVSGSKELRKGNERGT